MVGLINLLAVAQLRFRRCFRLRMASTAFFPCGASPVLAHQHRSPFRSASLGSAEGRLARVALAVDYCEPPVQRHRLERRRWATTAPALHRPYPFALSQRCKQTFRVPGSPTPWPRGD